MTRRFAMAATVAAAAAVGLGCQNTYYKALEKVGIEKRDVLVHRVEGAKESQEKAQAQFRDALEQYKALVGFSGGDLEAKYEKLRSEYESSKKRADDVDDKIRGVRNVADALFKEWQAELDQYTDATLRRESDRELRETRRRYDQVVAAMERGASKMNPVLRKLNDQVLFLKHNLNARALGALKTTADNLQVEVDALVKDMQASIAEASKFIDEMGKKNKE